jgi:hypothetical protein
VGKPAAVWHRSPRGDCVLAFIPFGTAGSLPGARVEAVASSRRPETSTSPARELPTLPSHSLRGRDHRQRLIALEMPDIGRLHGNFTCSA